jgi:hypothetical protein
VWKVKERVGMVDEKVKKKKVTKWKKRKKSVKWRKKVCRGEWV